MRYDRENRQIDKIAREIFVKTIETQSKIKLIASLCIFGTISLFVRNIALGSGMIALSRGVLGASFLLLYLALRKQRLDLPAIRKNLWILLLSGGVMGLNWALLFEAYRYTTVAAATLCYYMQPVFLTLAATVVLGEKLSLKKGLCVLVALCGMVLISGALGGGLPASGELKGIALGLGAACFYACVILCNKKLRDIGASRCRWGQKKLSWLRRWFLPVQYNIKPTVLSTTNCAKWEKTAHPARFFTGMKQSVQKFPTAFIMDTRRKRLDIPGKSR